MESCFCSTMLPSHSQVQLEQVAICECDFEELNHPPYSPGIALSAYYLFSKLKKDFRGLRFESDKEYCLVA